jgi:hypothetical protein
VFSVVVAAPGVDVAPAAGDVQFVFDAPVTDTNGGDDPWEFNKFTLVTTQNGQTACPLSWQWNAYLVPPYWQVVPDSAATGGIPACTMTDIGLYNGLTDTEYSCNFPQPTYSIQGTEYCAVNPGLEPLIPLPGGGDTGGNIIAAASAWAVTADFTGDGAYSPSYSAVQNFTVSPDGSG